MLLTCGSLNQVLEQSSKALENSDQAIGELRELVRALSLTFNELVDFVKSAWSDVDTNQDGSTSMWEIIMYIILGHSAVEGGKKGIGKIKNGTRKDKKEV